MVSRYLVSLEFVICSDNFLTLFRRYLKYFLLPPLYGSCLYMYSLFFSYYFNFTQSFLFILHYNLTLLNNPIYCITSLLLLLTGSKINTCLLLTFHKISKLSITYCKENYRNCNKIIQIVVSVQSG